MTIKEVQELLEVDERTIRRRIGKLEDTMSPHFENIRKKLDEAIKGEPAQLTLDEVLAIVRANGNETLAALLAENAANKNALAVYSPGSGGSFTKDDIARLVRQEVSRAVFIMGPPRLEPRRRNTCVDITQALRIMAKWDGQWIIRKTDYDKAIGLLMSARDNLITEE